MVNTSLGSPIGPAGWPPTAGLRPIRKIQGDLAGDTDNLAQANVDLMNALLPQTPLRKLGLKIVPRVYMQKLMGKEAMRRVGIQPVFGFWITKALLGLIPLIWRGLWKIADRSEKLRNHHEKLSFMFFQKLIREGTGRVVTFRIPGDLEDLRELAEVGNT